MKLILKQYIDEVIGRMIHCGINFNKCLLVLLGVGLLSNASANNMGSLVGDVTANTLVMSQIDVQLDAVDFEYSYEFEQAIKEQVSIAYLAVVQNFYSPVNNYNYLSFNIRMVEDYDRFIAIQKNEIGYVISRTGYYSLDSGQLTILKKLSNAQTFRTLKHEACHRVLHQNTRNRVYWLNEGIAENCEFAEFDQKTKKVVIHSHHINHDYVLAMAKKQKLLPLNALFSWTEPQRQQGDNAILRQVQSGEFIHFLLKQSNSKFWITQMLNQDGSFYNSQDVKLKEMMIDLEPEFANWLFH